MTRDLHTVNKYTVNNKTVYSYVSPANHSPIPILLSVLSLKYPPREATHPAQTVYRAMMSSTKVTWQRKRVIVYFHEPFSATPPPIQPLCPLVDQTHQLVTN